MLYMPAADPAGTIKDDTLTEAFLLRYAGRGLVHALQHLANTSRHMYVNGTGATEEFWLDEGLSQIAEELLFYRAAGLAPGKNLSLTTLYSSSRIYDASNQYGTFNVFNYGWWPAFPESTSRARSTGLHRPARYGRSSATPRTGTGVTRPGSGTPWPTDARRGWTTSPQPRGFHRRFPGSTTGRCRSTPTTPWRGSAPSSRCQAGTSASSPPLCPCTC